MSGEVGRAGDVAARIAAHNRMVDRYHEIVAEGDMAERSIAYMAEAFDRANLIFGPSST